MKLSDRQRTILLLLAQGKAKKEIASALNTSRSNVERIIVNIRKKCNCSNTTHLIAFCITNGYICVKNDMVKG